MHETLHKITPKLEAEGTVLRATEDWGGIIVSYAELPAGTDLGPLLEGLPGDKCPCPHWGFLIKGRITVSYANGQDETLNAGEVFYLPSGHTALVEQDATFVEFSPEPEYTPVMSHIMGKVAV